MLPASSEGGKASGNITGCCDSKGSIVEALHMIPCLQQKSRCPSASEYPDPI